MFDKCYLSMQYSGQTTNSDFNMNQESTFIHVYGHRLHLKHIYKEQGGQPILMLHGTIENGKIFYTASGKGLACYLADKGFDVYVADFRGKGESVPNISEESDHGQQEAITEDIPAFIDYVFKQTGKKCHVICHSWGGVLFASYLARYPESLSKVSSKICFGTKRTIHTKSFEKWLKVDLLWDKLAPRLAKKKGFIDSERLRFGAEKETYRFLKQSNIWVKQGPWRDTDDNFDYYTAASNLNWPPTWHLTGVKDKTLGNIVDVQHFVDECQIDDVEVSLLGKQQGNLVDYDHINILTHPSAQQDHFPKVVEWLLKYSPQASS